MELLDLLVEKQTSEALSNRAFALRLGISPALWTKTRNSKRRIRDAVLRGAIRAYPDLAPVAHSYHEARIGGPLAVAQGSGR